MKETEYWNNFYLNKKPPISQTPFATWLTKKIDVSNKNLIEFGSGNGRDTFFKKKCKRVVAYDGSEKAIKMSNEKLNRNLKTNSLYKNLLFKKLAFTNTGFETNYKINFKVDISCSKIFYSCIKYPSGESVN